jgi:outer membrane protein insertion porin family
MKVVSLLLALWMQVPATVNAPIIDDVAIRGNRRIQSTTIKYYIQSRRGDTVNRALVSRDIRAIYAREQFDDVWVESEETTPGHVILVFYVTEKPQIRSVEYKGLTSIQASDVLKALSEKKATLTQTQPYDETKIQKAVMIIKSLLAEKGRQKAEVEVTKEKVPPNSVLVTFNVTEGPKIKIDKIDFEGNKVFTDGQLKKSMKLVKEAGALTGFTVRTLITKENWLTISIRSERCIPNKGMSE